MNKPTLLILEGMDRTGKDTYLRMLEEDGYNVIHNDLEGMPSYLNPDYEAWLDGFYARLCNSLLVTDNIKPTAIVRFFTSDKVYSDLFDRPNLAEKFRILIEVCYNIVDYTLLYKDFAQYVQVMDERNEPLQYNITEFTLQQYLYRSYTDGVIRFGAQVNPINYIELKEILDND